MSQDAAASVSIFDRFVYSLDEACKVASKADRHGHSLKGTGFYAVKFHKAHAETIVLLREFESSFADNPHLLNALPALRSQAEQFFSHSPSLSDRRQILNQIKFLLRTEIVPHASKPKHQPTDDFFPLEIFSNTRDYIEKTAIQACGAYDQGWYDAAAVMSRKLLETLIIEIYEAHKLDHKLKKNGTFMSLSGLVGVIVNETAFNVGRNSKTALPRLKDLGDQSAHSRRYIAKRADLDAIKRDLRVVLEEFIHLSELKK